MARRVVDLFEAIQVDEQQGVLARRVGGLLQQRQQPAAVQQAGEGVAVALQQELFVELHHLGNRPLFLRDVRMRAARLLARARAQGSAHPPVPGQGHFKRNAQEVNAVLQSGLHVKQQLGADLLPRTRPVEPNNVFQRLAPGVLLRAQTVDRQKTIIGKNDTTLLVVDGNAIAELVKHPQRLLGRRAHPLWQG